MFRHQCCRSNTASFNTASFNNTDVAMRLIRPTCPDFQQATCDYLSTISSSNLSSALTASSFSGISATFSVAKSDRE